MALKDMKLSKKKQEGIPSPVETSLDSGPKYPYGLQLRLDEEQIKKLGGLKGAEVGGSVKIIATGDITSMREEARKEQTSKNVEIQITAIDIEMDDDFDNAYKEANEEE